MEAKWFYYLTTFSDARETNTLPPDSGCENLTAQACLMGFLPCPVCGLPLMQTGAQVAELDSGQLPGWNTSGSQRATLEGHGGPE